MKLSMLKFLLMRPDRASKAISAGSVQLESYQKL